MQFPSCSASNFFPVHHVQQQIAVGLAMVAVAVLVLFPHAAQAQQTAFTYQAQLQQSGAPVDGTKDLQFTLYDSKTGGSTVGSAVTKQDVSVSNGVLTTSLDFGAVFGDGPRFLEVGVRDGGSTGSFTTLSPRTRIRPAPLAMALPNVTVASDGNVGVATPSPTSPLTVNGTIESTSGGVKLPDGTMIQGSGDLGGGGSGWALGGNSGTDPTTGDFLGTTDETALELKVNGERALRIEPTVSAPNVIGGITDNRVSSGVEGATIGGGGFVTSSGTPILEWNEVGANFGTVSGGLNNVASGKAATVGGGGGNVASGDSATVAGGRRNEASGMSATVGGGADNTANADRATVVGGIGNTATGAAATAMGNGTSASGQDATAMSDGTTASGGNATAMGFQTTASGQDATAMGAVTTASGARATAMGRNTTASGLAATAMGVQTIAATNRSLSIGQFNSANTSDDNTLFVAGNGSSAIPSDALVLKKDGDLALGPSDPQDLRLHVAEDKANAGVNDSPGANMVLFENTNSGPHPDVLGLQAGPTDPPAGVTYVSFYQRDGTTIGTIEGNGSGGVNFNTTGSDYAEELPMRPGAATATPTDLVAVRGGEVTLDTEDTDRLMIVTDRAAVTGNAARNSNRPRVPVAFVGQVPVRLSGTAEVGDLIVASGQDDGTARAVAPAQYRPGEHGPIAGRAWSAKSSSGSGTVTVAVGLDQSGALVEQLQRQRSRIQEQNEQLRSQGEQLESLKERVRRLEALMQEQSNSN